MFNASLRILLLVFCVAQFAAADEIYSWTDAAGNRHFSSKPQKGAAPATLPSITKMQMKFPSAPAISCEQHGGVDCEAGADVDGSVICRDSFRDSKSRFLFSCTSTKLEVVGVTSPNPRGEIVVTVRNKKQVAAKKVKVTLRNGMKEKIVLSGPEEIENLGSEDYLFTPDPKLSSLQKRDKIDTKELELTCDNCQ